MTTTCDVITTIYGSQRYMALLDRIRADPATVAAMWEDAEGRPGELDIPGTRWSVAVSPSGDPMAWCAARVVGGVVLCHSNYERREYRGCGFYAQAYRQRHAMILAPLALPAVTYLYPEPIPLHTADGWMFDDGEHSSGVSTAHPGGPPHHWQRLVWSPPRRT